MKDLYLQLRNRKTKEDTSNGKSSSCMINLQEKQKKSGVKTHGNGLGKVI